MPSAWHPQGLRPGEASGERFGLSHEFLGRRDGWPGLQGAYGLPQKPSGLDHGIAYEAIAAGEIDVMDLYTTDAKIERYAIVALEDIGVLPRLTRCCSTGWTERFPKEVQYSRFWKAESMLPTMVKVNARAEIDGELQRRGAGIPRIKGQARRVYGRRCSRPTSAACWPSILAWYSARSPSPP